MRAWIGLLCSTLLAGSALAAEPAKGPVLEEFGPVYAVPGAVELGDPKQGVRAVFDVAAAEDDPGKVNRRIETVARFLNMHARAGFPRKKIEAALVLHGKATEAALDHEAYRKIHGVDNPNAALLAELRRAGVGIYLCGQSAAYRGIAASDLTESVELVLSAMTALIQLQSDGFALIAF